MFLFVLFGRKADGHFINGVSELKWLIWARGGERGFKESKERVFEREIGKRWRRFLYTAGLCWNIL